MLPDQHPAQATRRRRLLWLLGVLISALLVANVVVGVSRGGSSRQTRPASGIEPLDVDPTFVSYRFYDPLTREPVGFNPCEPIRYVVNEEHAPQGGLRDVREAVDRISAVSGIPFRFVGMTSEDPLDERLLHQPRRYGPGWAPLLVGWSPFGDDIEEGTLGTADGYFLGNDRDELVTVSGFVALNADVELPSGFGSGDAWGPVILHEIGHVMGLDHVDAPDQVMNHESLFYGPVDLGRGDRTGLVRLGKLKGCVEAPAPWPELAARATGPSEAHRVAYGRARFDPCGWVVYAINDRDAPPGGVEDVHRGFARLSAATGIRFAYWGWTDEDPSYSRDPLQPDRYDGWWAPVVVGWVPEYRLPYGERFRGGADIHEEPSPYGGHVAVTGAVLLNAERQLDPGYGRGATQGDLILHQLGHLAGLQDVDDPSQVMGQDAGPGRARWGAGDLAGLKKLGIEAGCIGVPESPALRSGGGLPGAGRRV